LSSDQWDTILAGPALDHNCTNRALAWAYKVPPATTCSRGCAAPHKSDRNAAARRVHTHVCVLLKKQHTHGDVCLNGFVRHEDWEHDTSVASDPEVSSSGSAIVTSSLATCRSFAKG
jgi:hypothetical protein